jgi:hypothetical protein
VPFPNPATQWKPGKSARPADCPTISKQRARRLAREAVIAEEITKITKQAPDFHGDAHDYLRGVYDGSVKPDPLRMQAAAQALKYEKPALAAVAIAQKGERTLIDLLALAGGNNASAPAIPDASADNLPPNRPLNPAQTRQLLIAWLSPPTTRPTLPSARSCYRCARVLLRKAAECGG